MRSVVTTGLRVVGDEDYRNAPKKRALKNLTVAIASADWPQVLSRLSDDIVWTVAGAERVKNKDEIAAALATLARSGATQLDIESIITQGANGAVNGVLTFADGRKLPFCDVYQFRDAKGDTIQRATSYGASGGPSRPAPPSIGGSAAVVERIKRYIEPWLTDRRMRISGEILLREIARIEKEEAEKADATVVGGAP